MKLQNNLYTTTGWEITEDDFDPEEIVTTGSNFMVGNGYLGYRGTFVELGEQDCYMVCIVSNTYDTADGKVAEKSIHFSKLASNIHAADGLNNSFQIDNAQHQRRRAAPSAVCCC